ncbi:hypothetical protein ACHAXR_000735, partial [Thalassiosira sp. AJA248-18]
QQPPPNEDCPICFVRLPLDPSDTTYKSCCGKTLCIGCAFADGISRRSTEKKCPFCRTPWGTSKDEENERLRKRVEAGDVSAMDVLGFRYDKGDGVPQDSNKALELWNQAAKLGSADSHGYLGHAYFNGEVVEEDKKKADEKKGKYHWERAAMGGDVSARHCLGEFELHEGNKKRAMKHFMISASYGYDDSLKEIQNGFLEGLVKKDDFEKALRAHKESKDEMQSDQRDTLRHIILSHKSAVATSMPRET